MYCRTGTENALANPKSPIFKTSKCSMNQNLIEINWSELFFSQTYYLLRVTNFEALDLDEELFYCDMRECLGEANT